MTFMYASRTYDAQRERATPHPFYFSLLAGQDVVLTRLIMGVGPFPGGQRGFRRLDPISKTSLWGEIVHLYRRARSWCSAGRFRR